jgi:hypothetical protein
MEEKDGEKRNKVKNKNKILFALFSSLKFKIIISHKIVLETH